MEGTFSANPSPAILQRGKTFSVFGQRAGKAGDDASTGPVPQSSKEERHTHRRKLRWLKKGILLPYAKKTCWYSSEKEGEGEKKVQVDVGLS